MPRFTLASKPDLYFQLSGNMLDDGRTPVSNRMRAMIAYGLYRDALYDSRKTQALDLDVALYPPKFNYKTGDSLYHYCATVSGGAIKEARETKQAKAISVYSKDDDKLLGFISFYPCKKDGHDIIYISHVTAKVRGRGIGGALIKSVFSLYKEGQAFYLNSRRSNVSALGLYEKLGFKVCEDAFEYDPKAFVTMKAVTDVKALLELNYSDSAPDSAALTM